MFETYKKIEDQAKIVMNHTRDNQAGSNCYKIANTLDTFKASTLQDLVIKKLSKSF